jgi:hypothetical protein
MTTPLAENCAPGKEAGASAPREMALTVTDCHDKRVALHPESVRVRAVIIAALWLRIVTTGPADLPKQPTNRRQVSHLRRQRVAKTTSLDAFARHFPAVPYGPPAATASGQPRFRVLWWSRSAGDGVSRSETIRQRLGRPRVTVRSQVTGADGRYSTTAIHIDLIRPNGRAHRGGRGVKGTVRKES